MKTTRIALLAAWAGMAGGVLPLGAAAYTFDNLNTAGLQDGGGNWNTTTANWWNAADVAWPNLNTDEAIFGVSSTGSNNTVNAPGRYLRPARGAVRAYHDSKYKVFRRMPSDFIACRRIMDTSSGGGATAGKAS